MSALLFEVHYRKAQIGEQIDRVVRSLAWKLPRRLVMWCFVRVVAHATAGEWGNSSPTEVNTMEALNRWEK